MVQTMNQFPEWIPVLKDDFCVLVIGASGGIGRCLVRMLLKSKANIGCHFASNREGVSEFEKFERVKTFQKFFQSSSDCEELVEEFFSWKKRIDGIVVLSGGIKKTTHWEQLSSEEWESDIFLNLSVPFYLARASFKKMRESGSGGRIILTGTESALHGGGSFSLAYGVAKMGIECLVKGLARDGAKYNILVNGIRPGFIMSGFHQRWQNKNETELENRVDMIPLKRAGTPEEVAVLILYLLSEWASFITGQMFAITGGDWL